MSFVLTLFCLSTLPWLATSYPSSDALYGRDKEVKRGVVIVEDAGRNCKVSLRRLIVVF
jgi:hypothetical protein